MWTHFRHHVVSMPLDDTRLQWDTVWGGYNGHSLAGLSVTAGPACRPHPSYHVVTGYKARGVTELDIPTVPEFDDIKVTVFSLLLKREYCRRWKIGRPGIRPGRAWDRSFMGVLLWGPSYRSRRTETAKAGRRLPDQEVRKGRSPKLIAKPARANPKGQACEGIS